MKNKEKEQDKSEVNEVEESEIQVQDENQKNKDIGQTTGKPKTQITSHKQDENDSANNENAPIVKPKPSNIPLKTANTKSRRKTKKKK